MINVGLSDFHAIDNSNSKNYWPQDINSSYKQFSCKAKKPVKGSPMSFKSHWEQNIHFDELDH